MRASTRIALVGLGATLACTPSSQRGYEPAQPQPFSHAQHAGESRIPCLYCHSGALVSRHAGLPAGSTCMNCHARIRREAPAIQRLADDVAAQRPTSWIKVHRLPDHTYFSHASHLGVSCQTCHGPVETMVRVAQVGPQSMGWCVDCHRNCDSPRPDPDRCGSPGGGTAPIEPRPNLIDCIACHR